MLRIDLARVLSWAELFFRNYYILVLSFCCLRF